MIRFNGCGVRIVVDVSPKIISLNDTLWFWRGDCGADPIGTHPAGPRLSTAAVGEPLLPSRVLAKVAYSPQNDEVRWLLQGLILPFFPPRLPLP